MERGGGVGGKIRNSKFLKFPIIFFELEALQNLVNWGRKSKMTSQKKKKKKHIMQANLKFISSSTEFKNEVRYSSYYSMKH